MIVTHRSIELVDEATIVWTGEEGDYLVNYPGVNTPHVTEIVSGDVLLEISGRDNQFLTAGQRIILPLNTTYAFTTLSETTVIHCHYPKDAGGNTLEDISPLRVPIAKNFFENGTIDKVDLPTVSGNFSFNTSLPSGFTTDGFTTASGILDDTDIGVSSTANSSETGSVRGNSFSHTLTASGFGIAGIVPRGWERIRTSLFIRHSWQLDTADLLGNTLSYAVRVEQFNGTEVATVKNVTQSSTANNSGGLTLEHYDLTPTVSGLGPLQFRNLRVVFTHSGTFARGSRFDSTLVRVDWVKLVVTYRRINGE